MSKLIFTRSGNIDIQAKTENGKLLGLSCYPFSETSLVGRLIIGKVKNIKASIQAAFVEFQEGQMGFLDLKTPLRPFVMNRPEDGRLLEGDEILVQIEREASRGKMPLLTARYTLTGKYVVLTRGHNRLSISSQWKNSPEAIEAKNILLPFHNKEFGLILRTNARDLPAEQLQLEIQKKIAEYQQMVEQAKYRTCFSVLWQPIPSYLEEIRDRKEELSVVTDLPEVMGQLKNYAAMEEPELVSQLFFYEDSFPLVKLHSLESKLEDHLQKKVWMKSGGFLTFEQTEALVVIDVNSGKGGNKNQNTEENYYRLNLEAAEVIAHELQIRNLSGIILVDFVDMQSEEHKEALLTAFRGFCKKDPVYTEVVDMTKLGLVELTRKKAKKPLTEQVNFFQKTVDNLDIR